MVTLYVQFVILIITLAYSVLYFYVYVINFPLVLCAPQGGGIGEGREGGEGVCSVGNVCVVYKFVILMLNVIIKMNIIIVMLQTE